MQITAVLAFTTQTTSQPIRVSLRRYCNAAVDSGQWSQGAPGHTLFFMEKLMKLVSTSTWYGGPSCVLYLKNSAVGVFSLANTPAAHTHSHAHARVPCYRPNSPFKSLTLFTHLHP